ncbi:MAG: phosphotriesterase [Actinomycetia bacterium]|nr:phosphotriesterase [Actinomycetes bacterium]
MVDELTVETARGPVPLSALGTTLMHEHVFITSPEVMQNWPDYPEGFEEDERVRDAVAQLQRAKASGIDTIVDCTVIGLGRYVPRVQRVAAAVDVNIIVSTGVYTYNDVPMYFYFRGPGTHLAGPETMTEFFVKDITQGIGRTGVKAAILKCATDSPGLTPGVERVLRAVAVAHRETGVPITTHTHAASRRGLEQQRVFTEEGVDLTRVIIGHSGDSTDVGYLEELLANGSYIGMDRFGVEGPDFDARVGIVATMCERGHAERMVLSHDTMCFSDLIDFGKARRDNPNWTFDHITRDVLPALRARGVDEQQIREMLVENPKRIFACRGSY